MPKLQKSVFTRLIEADKKQGPLKLRPGDVMQLVNFLVEVECEHESTFLNRSAYGHRKRFGPKLKLKE